MPLNAAIGHHGHQFQGKKLSFGVVKSLSKANVQKAQTKPSTWLIKVTSCVDRSNAAMKAEELSYLSSYQMLTADKNN